MSQLVLGQAQSTLKDRRDLDRGNTIFLNPGKSGDVTHDVCNTLRTFQGFVDELAQRTRCVSIPCGWKRVSPGITTRKRIATSMDLRRHIAIGTPSSSRMRVICRRAS